MDSIRIIPDAPAAPPEAPAQSVTETAEGVAVRPAPETAQPDETKTPNAERPSWLPEKFKSAEDMASAYAALEKKLGTNKSADPAPAETQTPSGDAGLDLSAMSAEFAKDGKLSDASTAALKKAGLKEADVQRFIAGQQAIAKNVQAEVAAVAGGEDKLAATLEWAKTNADKALVATYNDAIDSGNVSLVKLAAKSLVDAHAAATGTDGKRVTGEPVETASADAPFKSNAEMTKAMGDPRYAKDPAYREAVSRRLANTKMFGV